MVENKNKLVFEMGPETNAIIKTLAILIIDNW